MASNSSGGNDGWLMVIVQPTAKSDENDDGALGDETSGGDEIEVVLARRNVAKSVREPRGERPMRESRKEGEE